MYNLTTLFIKFSRAIFFSEPVACLEENCHTPTTAEEFPLNGSSPMQRVAEVKKNIE